MPRRKVACKRCANVFSTHSSKRRLCYECDPIVARDSIKPKRGRFKVTVLRDALVRVGV